MICKDLKKQWCHIHAEKQIKGTIYSKLYALKGTIYSDVSDHAKKSTMILNAKTKAQQSKIE